MKQFFRYDRLTFRYEPFPIGLAKPLFDEADYRALLRAWPATERFASLSKVGDKLALSEKWGADNYRDLVRNDPVWREFHGWIKSDSFVRGVLDALRARHIELGFDLDSPRARMFLRRLADAWRGGSRISSLLLGARFEFSMMPAAGGHILPHADGVQKVVTLVVPIVEPGEWDPAWGGGTDVNMPKDVQRSFNRCNEQLGFDDVTVLDTFAFEPNQGLVFIKTFNSWHSVRPMTGPANVWRRTLTINIETPG